MSYMKHIALETRTCGEAAEDARHDRRDGLTQRINANRARWAAANKRLDEMLTPVNDQCEGFGCVDTCADCAPTCPFCGLPAHAKMCAPLRAELGTQAMSSDELNARLLNRIAELGTQLAAAHEAIKYMLDEGNFIFSQADNASVFSIHLAGTTYDEFAALAGYAPKEDS